ncbi:molybdate ABC transporter substrate-binding protein [Roseibium alexandrii]|uniref:Molybdate-binding protein ModA n=1 Tax=Roseibium alexandrii (strain DSM 17067 / NCIMB 14079 / DFL-11) TaxID=244592 RepID=A0A5E8GT81_ROSAD|nr:molybdate ABC transporter substrate-binding protein [Roseibium alexandrii]EEE43039.2 molybdenum ABC transporter, periplasmic molybdate-binding protein [Roseibium alexandrii DFL-11]
MRLSLILAAVFVLAQTVVAAAERPLTVFAASSMSEAMGAIGAAFEAEGGVAVTFSFAGTGTLARQIEAGAPADVFVSADTLWMDYLKDRGAVLPESETVIASNRIILAGALDSAPLDLSADAIAARLGDGRLAIADPDTVPAGRYGKAALTALGLWPGVESRLAPMENVRVALAAAARGDTPLALVYATDAAIEPNVRVLAELPADSHPRIEYPAALTTDANHPQAVAFLDFLSGPEAVKILRSFGFVTHKEE